MPRLHIIIGDSNTRKSSLLRCLTGVGGGNSRKNLRVSLTDGNVIVVRCIPSALQEIYKPRTPAQFIDEIQRLNPIPTDIALALRVTAQGHYPHAVDYLQAFQQAAWQVANIALLGTSACALQGLPQSANIARKPNSPDRPTNETAHQVRQVWTWL